MTAYERLQNELKHLALAYEGEEFDKLMFFAMTGKINFAAEYKLITADEWKDLFSKVLAVINTNGV